MDYNSSTRENDIAAVKISGLTLGGDITAVSLPNVSDASVATGDIVLATGWLTNDGSGGTAVGSIREFNLYTYGKTWLGSVFNPASLAETSFISVGGGASFNQGLGSVIYNLTGSKILGFSSAPIDSGVAQDYNVRVNPYLNWIGTATGVIAAP